jgi:hypothetical protein
VPNHHLTDQHNPTAPVDPAKLRLFREFKDPVILSPQFHPLYIRFAYLMRVETESDLDRARASTVELIAFVNALKMGGFYHTRVADLLVDNAPSRWGSDPVDEEGDKRRKEAYYREKLVENRQEAIDLIIEMLRYQDWPVPPPRTSSGS